MRRKTNEFLMDVDFRCPCNSVIGVKAPLAAVKATGWEVSCKNCQRTFLVTEEGAIPTDGRPISGTVHTGHLAWDPTQTVDREIAEQYEAEQSEQEE